MPNAFTKRGARGKPGRLKPETYAKLLDCPYDDPFYCRGGWGGRRKAGGKGLVLAHDGSNTQNHCTAVVLPDLNLAVLAATNQGGDAGEQACTEAREELTKLWLAR